MISVVNFISACDSFNWYGFLIGFGMITCFVIAYFLAKDRGYYKDLIFDIAIICVPLAIVGARLYYVIFDIIGANGSWTFKEIIGLETGGLMGLSIFGGLLGAISGAVIIHFWKHKKPEKDRITFFQIVDLGFCLIPLGQAIGRWGNFANGEAYGPKVDWNFFPLTVFIQNGVSGTGHYLATFFYESMWDLAICGFLIFAYRGKRKSFDGSIFASYCILYGTGRAIIESLRQDPLMAGKLKVSQFTAILFILFGISYIIWYMYKMRESGLKPFVFVDKAKLDKSYYGYEKSMLSHPNIYPKKGEETTQDDNDGIEDFYASDEFYDSGDEGSDEKESILDEPIIIKKAIGEDQDDSEEKE